MSTSPHTYGPTCLLGPAESTKQPVILEETPPLRAQFFFNSPLALDDPLSPVPPPTNSTSSTLSKRPPRPFSAYDNAALEEAWAGLEVSKLALHRGGKGAKADKKRKGPQPKKDLSLKKDTKAEVKADVKADAKAEAKIDAKVDAKSRAKIDCFDGAGRDCENVPTNAETVETFHTTAEHKDQKLNKKSSFWKRATSSGKADSKTVSEAVETAELIAKSDKLAKRSKSKKKPKKEKSRSKSPRGTDLTHTEHIPVSSSCTTTKETSLTREPSNKQSSPTSGTLDKGLSLVGGVTDKEGLVTHKQFTKDISLLQEELSGFSGEGAYSQNDSSKGYSYKKDDSGKDKSTHKSLSKDFSPDGKRVIFLANNGGTGSRDQSETASTKGGPSAFGSSPSENTSTTGTPFLRALGSTAIRRGERGSRFERSESEQEVEHLVDEIEDEVLRGRSGIRASDYRAGLEIVAARSPSRATSELRPRGFCGAISLKDAASIPVGISRLHIVNLPSLQIKPIYWSPLHDDTAVVCRGTWFYKDTMLPIEPEVANQLELGYSELKPWSETWQDELNSALEVGPEGEEKVVYRIWPVEDPKDKPKDESRPATATALKSANSADTYQNNCTATQCISTCHCKTISISAEGVSLLDSVVGKDGVQRRFPNSVVLYTTSKDAFILKPGLQPSAYYGRKPLANIRKGKNVGIPIVRGFSWRAWEKIHPPKKTAYQLKVEQAAAMSQSGTAKSGNRAVCEACLSDEHRPRATDLVLVIHGIGQKMSEKVESWNFTHAMNSFRRNINVELAGPSALDVRPELTGIMALPINWRSNLSFEGSSHSASVTNEPNDSSANVFGLKDITPDSIPAVRNLVNEVMSDIPYYLSHHKAEMIAAVVKEANRVYRLWCKNNPGFDKAGRVHVIAHSLGSAMAIDILSKQPTKLTRDVDWTSKKINTKHFEFDTKNLFFCGSPAGFFLLLNKGTLIPRKGRNKPGTEGEDASKEVAGEAGTYGCLAVDNLYNILAHNDR